MRRNKPRNKEKEKKRKKYSKECRLAGGKGKKGESEREMGLALACDRRAKQFDTYLFPDAPRLYLPLLSSSSLPHLSSLSFLLYRFFTAILSYTMSSKRGRKRNDNLPPNRARDVQRAFRARRAAHLEVCVSPPSS